MSFSSSSVDGDYLNPVTNINIHYRITSPSLSSPLSSPPPRLVLIMGLLTELSAWSPQASYFSSHGYSVLTYDHRGVGLSSSPPPPSSYSTSLMSSDLLSLLDHLDWHEFHLIAISLGGMIAQHLALSLVTRNSLHRLLSLTLCVTHRGSIGGIAPMAGTIAILKDLPETDAERKVENTMNMLYSKRTLSDATRYESLYEYHSEANSQRKQPTIPAVFGHLRSVLTHHINLHQFLYLRWSAVPILILVGEEDKLVRRENSTVLAHVTGGKFIQLPLGHAMSSENPELFNQTIHEHIKEAEEIRKKRGDEAIHTTNKLFSQELSVLESSCSHSSLCLFHQLEPCLKGGKYFLSLHFLLFLCSFISFVPFLFYSLPNALLCYYLLQSFYRACSCTVTGVKTYTAMKRLKRSAAASEEEEKEREEVEEYLRKKQGFPLHHTIKLPFPSLLFSILVLMPIYSILRTEQLAYN